MPTTHRILIAVAALIVAAVLQWDLQRWIRNLDANLADPDSWI